MNLMTDDLLDDQTETESGTGQPDRVRSFDPATLANAPATTVFVTGASRSGTTLVSRLLHLHSAIHSTNELHCFGDLVPDPDSTFDSHDEQRKLIETLCERARFGLWRTRKDPETSAMARSIAAKIPHGPQTGLDLFFRFAAATTRQAGARVLCEHTPRNIFFANDLLKADRNARVIHVVRDPRAVLASQKHRHRRGRLDSVHIPLREQLRVAASFHPVITTRLWRQATRAALQLNDNPNVLVVRYEDMVLDAEKTCRRMLDFLGLAWEPQILDVVVTGSSHHTTDETDTGLSTKSLYRWNETLSLGEIRICERIAASEMNTFGYGRPEGSQPGRLEAIALMALLPLKLALVCLIDPSRVRVQLRSMLSV